MNNFTPSTQLEDKIRAAIAVPQALPEFVNRLHAELMRQASLKNRKVLRPFYLRPAWIAFLAVITLLIGSTLIIGPQRVYAAVRQLFGYIPGVGIVDQSAPIRVLAERVSVTRDGITVSVNQATLTADRTQIDFGVSGVPLSAYPGNEAVSGCIDPEYLLLLDGTKQDLNAPIPANVNEATFVMPCIFNTIPGSVPTDWEIPIKFAPAPPGMTVMPVIELTPTVQETSAPAVTSAVVVVERIIETEDGYILIGSLRQQTPGGTWLQETSVPWIRDANDQKVSYSMPEDINLPYDASLGQGGFSWAFRIKAAGVAFPLSIHFSGVLISQVDPQATAEVAFDSGSNPQPDQVWTLNQDVQLAGHTVRLVSVTAHSDAYSFAIDPGSDLSGMSVQISGYEANGGGGGGGSGAWGGEFTTSLVYSELPEGILKIILSNPLTASATQTWVGEWQPDAPRTDWPSSPTDAAYPVCVTASSFENLSPLPAGLAGRALLTELNPEFNIVIVNMDGSQRQVLVPQGGQGSLSLDGSRMAYPGTDGITILNISSGESSLLQGASGYDLHWSPDGQQIAYVNKGDAYGIFVTSTDGSSQRQLSTLGYESIAGWSPDGKQLYYAIPDSSGEGWLLKSVEVETGAARDLFVLKYSSRKAPFPVVSPDGNWIAYRGVDNGSLYMMRMDGTQRRLLIEKPSLAYAISGIAWGPGGDLLGVSMLTPDAPDGSVILMKWETCETYILPSLHGELDGLLIP